MVRMPTSAVSKGRDLDELLPADCWDPAPPPPPVFSTKSAEAVGEGDDDEYADDEPEVHERKQEL